MSETSTSDESVDDFLEVRPSTARLSSASMRGTFGVSNDCVMSFAFAFDFACGFAFALYVLLCFVLCIVLDLGLIVPSIRF